MRKADILPYPLPRAEYLVFANPPFDITAELVRKLTTAEVPPRDAYLALQGEAAERYLGRPRMTLSALLIAPWFSLRVVHRFARADFDPMPSVDVVLVGLHKRGPPLVSTEDAQLFMDFAARAFVSRQPAVGPALAQVLGARTARALLARARVSGAATPSSLRLREWLRLFEHFARLPPSFKDKASGAAARLRRQQRRLRKVHRTRVPRDTIPWGFGHEVDHTRAPACRPRRLSLAHSALRRRRG